MDQEPKVQKKKRGKISYKRLASLTSLGTFLIMTITGIILYFTPEGRVAYWVNWEFAGLTKSAWGSLHVISSLVFVVAGAFHIYFNWKPLVNYLSGKLAGGLQLNRELGWSIVISVVVIIGSITLFPPFDSIMNFSEYLKSSWVKAKEYEPPFGHAEDVSLKIFTRKMDIDLEKAVAELKAEGIEFDSVDEKLKDIAARNDLTPMEIYIPIKKFEPKEELAGVVFTPDMVEEKFTGTGIGQKTLPWFLEDIGLDPAVARAKLAANDIEIGDDETLKKAADRYGTEPIEILKVILVDGYIIPHP